MRKERIYPIRSLSKISQYPISGPQKTCHTARKKIDAALAGEPGMEEYDYEVEESDVADQGPKTKPTSDPRRFFQKKAK